MLETEKVQEYRDGLLAARKEIEKVMVGLDDVVEETIIALLSGGHVLLEGVPGVGKTMLVRSFSQALNLDYSRIQFTPDLMPADITGTNILMEDRERHRYFEFQEGPLFANIILADEINRATPKTQSALLEAMQERRVTVAGETREIGEPFCVLATQNPLEMEGTYPLPEAQVDRFFFKLRLGYPDFSELKEIVNRTTIGEEPEASPVLSGDLLCEMQRDIRELPIADEVLSYAVRIVLASQPQNDTAAEDVQRYVRYGASPRGAQALVLAGKARAFLSGRFNVSFADIRSVTLPALRHRMILNFEGEAAEVDTDDIVASLLDYVPETSEQHAG